MADTEKKETLKERFDDFKEREHEKHEERKEEREKAEQKQIDHAEKDKELFEHPDRVIDMEDKIAAADEWALQRE